MKGKIEMKTFLIILFIVFLFCLYFLKGLNDKAYNDCVNAGVQSNDVCYQLAYM